MREISEHWKKFEEILKEKAVLAEEKMKAFLPVNKGYADILAESMKYSFLSGGKRLRPMLMAETGLLFGEESPMLPGFMAMIEMIHTYSLIHDDLPAMDNDDYRRGRKTNHVVYGEAMAILAGDALLNLAYETGLETLELAENTKQLRAGIKCLSIMADRAGINGMVGGQARDVECEKNPTSRGNEKKQREILDFIHRGKTAALIEAAMMSGAALSGASAEELEKVSRAAVAIGTAFQIQDDILDVRGNQEILGKPIGSDERNGKLTYVSLYGMEDSEKKVEELSGEALDIISSFQRRNEFLEDLIKYLAGREA